MRCALLRLVFFIPRSACLRDYFAWPVISVGLVVLASLLLICDARSWEDISAVGILIGTVWMSLQFVYF